MSAIYLHIPFCKRLCGYCDFFKSVKVQHLESCVEAMEREIAQQRNYLSGSRVETIYFGGGTPSLLSPAQLERLMGAVTQNFDCSGVREITLEANPDDLSEEYLTAIYNKGINRLSVGIQSFDDKLLRFMNRRHSAASAVEAVRAAQRVGFENITIDLIFGVDGFGEQTLRSSIEQAVALDVQHISAYHLTLEPNTPFARRLSRGELREVSEQTSESEYRIMDEALTQAGFEHYEVSNYARPGFRSQHNSSYWHGVHYLGIGAGAHSFNGVERRITVESIEKYLEGGEQRYESEALSPVDNYNEYVMTSLRCCEGVNLTLLKERFGADMAGYLTKNIEPWLSDCKVERRGDSIFIPPANFLISDSIIESLFYCSDK